MTFTVTGPLRDVWNCHCSRCRRITGHHLAATAAERDAVQVDGEVTWWTPDGTAAYGFCGTCGSTLFWRAAATPGRLSVAAGALDPPTGLTTTVSWWSAEASDYHRHPDGVRLVAYEDDPGDAGPGRGRTGAERS